MNRWPQLGLLHFMSVAGKTPVSWTFTGYNPQPNTIPFTRLLWLLRPSWDANIHIDPLLNPQSKQSLLNSTQLGHFSLILNHLKLDEIDVPSLGKQGQGDNNLGSNTGVLTNGIKGRCWTNMAINYAGWLITAVSSLVILVLVGTVVTGCVFILLCASFAGENGERIHLRHLCAVAFWSWLKKDRESQSQNQTQK